MPIRFTSYAPKYVSFVYECTLAIADIHLNDLATFEQELLSDIPEFDFRLGTFYPGLMLGQYPPLPSSIHLSTDQSCVTHLTSLDDTR